MLDISLFFDLTKQTHETYTQRQQQQQQQQRTVVDYIFSLRGKKERVEENRGGKFAGTLGRTNEPFIEGNTRFSLQPTI